MDPYVYPGTNVLKNLRDIRDPRRLARLEEQATNFRIRQLENKPVTASFDSRHLRSIHRHIFKDVYVWAGEFRTVNIGKSAGFFALKEHLQSSLTRIFEELHRDRCLHGYDFTAFCNRGAYYLGEINAVHPFREGNGRAQRQLIRDLAVHSGFSVDWSRISREQMIDASKQSLRRDNDALERLLRSALEPREYAHFATAREFFLCYLKRSANNEGLPRVN